jgi:hypothetical protein
LRRCGCLTLFSLGLLFVLFCVVFLGPVSPGIKQARHNVAMQQARQIGQAFFTYAMDKNGTYPDGKSSTEIFQKLMDDGYIEDPAILYVPLQGKVKGIVGQKLKPENVCFDVTGGVDSSSSDLVPIIFMTGYKVTYAPGGEAVPVIKPYPPYWNQPRTWWQWWNGNPEPDHGASGIAVFYKGNNAMYWRVAADYTVPKIVSPDFKPDGHTYRQLTPDGVLP